jgi:hypothetical protein
MYSPKLSRIGLAPMLLILLALAACGAPNGSPAGEPTPTLSPPATLEATATATEPVEAGASPTAVVEEPTATETVIPTETAVSGGLDGEGSPPVDLTNPFPKILGLAPAPEGWSVRPCEGDGPILCVLEGTVNIGFVHLSSYPLETMTDFQKMLSDAGLDAETFDYKDPGDAARARQALQAFVENYHSVIMKDREATFGGTKGYRRLETEEINVGELPALRYGLVILNQDGSVYERWLSYSAFDGEGLFTIVASFYPNRELSFRSDEDLLKFEPFLVEIIKGLKLPHPEVRGDKSRG